MKHLGHSLARIGARAHVVGGAVFADDLHFAGELHMRLVRAPVARGVLRHVDKTAAAALDGVVAVWSARDVALGPVPIRLHPSDTLAAHAQPVLAKDVIRFAGEPVAAVFAVSASIAEDAAECVALAITPQAPILDPRAETAHVVGDRCTSEAATLKAGFGDVQRAFQDADHIVEQHVALARDGAMPLETRTTIARWDPGQQTLTMSSAVRAPHETRELLAEALDLPSAAVQIETPHVGGCFGARAELYPEDLLVAHAARTLERPIRFVETRREHMEAAAQGRGLTAVARTAVTDAGMIRALDVEFWVDQGAYIRPEGLWTPDLVTALLPGPYELLAYRTVGHVRLTNKAPAGAMRGAGRMEATFVRERLIDAVAQTLGMAPLALRLKNLGETRPAAACRDTGSTVGPGTAAGMHTLIKNASQFFALEAARQQFSDRRRRGVRTGVGLALFNDVAGTDIGGLGASDRVLMRVDRRGHVEVVTGTVDAGHGIHTGIAQIVADIIGVDYDEIRITAGNTARLDDAAGRFAARGLTLSGIAALRAAEALREQILARAAAVLGRPPEHLLIQGGRITAADLPFGTALTLGELAHAVALEQKRGAGASLVAEGWSHADSIGVPAGLAAAVVTIDAPTGMVRVERACVAAEVGNLVNPELAERQIAGAALEAIAGALFTSLPVNEDGNALVQSFCDLHMPSAAELPTVEVFLTDDDPFSGNPLGIRGVANAGIIATAAAVAAAVDEALGAPGFATSLPLTPIAIRAQLRKASRAPRRQASSPPIPLARSTG